MLLIRVTIWFVWVAFKNVVDEAGGIPVGTGKIVGGGPMMGRSFMNLNVPMASNVYEYKIKWFNIDQLMDEITKADYFGKWF